MTDRLQVRLLGEFGLVRAGSDLGPITSTRARSLIAFLARHAGEHHSRQRLAFMLWPDSTESQSRTNLRNVLHVVRHAVPDVDDHLEVTPTSLQWRLGSRSEVD